MRVFVLSVGALVTVALLFVTGHFAWRQFVRLAYVSRLDRWGEPARRATEDEWSEDIPEWH